MRLDRYICAATGCSRSEAQRLIKTGRICVDDQPASIGKTQVQTAQAVTLDGLRLSSPGPIYLMLHKPAGYVCSTDDGEHPIVIDPLYLDPSIRRFVPRLQIVGRLDIDTTGLLLLTDDGQWNHRITSPKSRCTKVYRAQLAEPIDERSIRQLQQGVLLRGEETATLPCTIHPLGDCDVEIQINEGRYHQVKRMFASVGNKVIGLHRQQIGSIVLDPDLQPGQFRHLTSKEVDSVNG